MDGLGPFRFKRSALVLAKYMVEPSNPAASSESMTFGLRRFHPVYAARGGLFPAGLSGSTEANESEDPVKMLFGRAMPGGELADHEIGHER